MQRKKIDFSTAVPINLRHKQSGHTATIQDKPRGIRQLLGEREQQRQQELLAALQRVSRVLTVEVDVQKILQDMATIVAQALGAKWVNFWELTGDKKALYVRAAYGMQLAYMEQSRRHPIPLGKAWIGRAVKTGKPWGTSDILKDPRLLKDLGTTWKQAVKRQDYQALLCVPTISRKGPVGGMCVYFPERHEFTDFEMRLVMVAANQAATSITNAQIFNDLVVERNKTLAIVNSLSDGLIMYDLEGRIILFNPRAEEILWIQRNLVLAKKPEELSLRINPLFKNIQDISSLALREFETRQLTLTEPQRATIAITNLPVRGTHDQKLGSMRILHDITKEKEIEELKSSFVSIASHQLRTPLSGIKWSLSMIHKGDFGTISPKAGELIEKTLASTDRLISLVNDLLNVSRIEEGHFGYEFQKIDMYALVQEALKEFGPVLKQKEKRFLILHPPKKPFSSISADIKKLRMAVFNIIDNAIKYTPRGLVKISLHRGTTYLILQIEDTGIGIPKEYQKFLFTKFFRAPNAIRLQTEGSGLGLWIANEIVKHHNGRISFESEENKGSTFSIHLPIVSHLMPKAEIKGD